MEAKGCRVIAGKTQVMQCRASRFHSGDSGKHLCGVCMKEVARNSILFVECLRWVHERCSGISRKLKINVDFSNSRCLEEDPVETVSELERG